MLEEIFFGIVIVLFVMSCILFFLVSKKLKKNIFWAILSLIIVFVLYIFGLFNYNIFHINANIPYGEQNFPIKLSLSAGTAIIVIIIITFLYLIYKHIGGKNGTRT